MSDPRQGFIKVAPYDRHDAASACIDQWLDGWHRPAYAQSGHCGILRRSAFKSTTAFATES
jgi:hypothetical protein